MINTSPSGDRDYAIISLTKDKFVLQAWVTSLSPDGHLNAAPFSFFNALGANPPIIGFCPGDRDDGQPKDTARMFVRQMNLWSIWSTKQWPRR